MKLALGFGLLVACVCATLADNGYRIQFTARSVKSDMFSRQRADKTTALISGCGKEVTEPLGILEQTYKNGSAKNGDVCTWKIHAPSNYRVNVISLIFVLEDEITPSRSDSVKTSSISLYDGAAAVEENLLTRYIVSPQEKVGNFIKSTSSSQDMTIEIKYFEHKDFAAQKIIINYEFLNLDQAKELSRAQQTASTPI